ncbi:putative selenium-dependent hydroxylase accessory protein YqeC [Photobacterium sp. SDRW27]|uniref:selenium cofactor biosynthesis protein YqeC n=1 Tax=Photobacterium obscurum TaxID=2829490 RepID=UPI002243DAF2|nr:selenium cofactor biosynthesis protein YqeC [Photobacterium obscurum]MCW8331172.1 putative selenium-dependent hydroxylase accessory protein YqeC [Photobacterium obscurum]
MKLNRAHHPFCQAQFELSMAMPFVISLVGGGGKTSTAFWLAEQFKQQGHCVLVTTTTKMYLPEENQADHFIYDNQHNTSLIAQLKNKLSDQSITFCYKNIINSNNKNTKNKVSGVTSELIDELKSDCPFTVLIIEADGAKCLPIKAPNGHEPCIPISSDMVIGVTGAEVIHTQAEPERIHRWNTFSALTQCVAGDSIDHRVLGNLIEHPQGMFKQAQKQAIKIWLINKIDLAPNYSSLQQLAKQVMTQTNQLDAIWLAAMNSQTPIKEVLIRHEEPMES